MDDLISLDWSSSSSSSNPPPLSAPPKPSNASFDLFAQPKAVSNGANYHSSIPPLKSATPTLSPIPTSARIQPQASGSRPRSNNASPNPVSPPSHDAFSALLSINGSSSSENKNLSLAERQAKAAEEKRQKADHERAQFEAHSSFWDNLGSSKPSPEADSANAFGAMLQPNSASSSRPRSAVPQVSLQPSWDDDDGLLGAGPSSIKQTSSSSSNRQPTPQPHDDDPFDFDALAARTSHLKVEEKSKGSSGMRTPVSDFDFGENQEAGSDEDVLGDLGRPTKPLSETIERSPTPPKATRRPRSPRSNSPPPHVIGRIVEMGFSPVQARQALAKTSSGLDVEAAIESLLAQQGPNHSDGGDEARRREEAERERRRRRRAGPSRDSVRARSKEEIRAGAQPEFGDQADKFIAQATEIGQSVFSKATSLWSTGREKAMKAYEEQRKAMDSDRPLPRKDGRPRWMIERDEQERNGPSEQVSSGFKDDDSSEEERPRPMHKANGRASKPRQQRLPKEDSRGADLLFDSEPVSSANGSRSKPQTRPVVHPKPAPPRPVTPLVKRKLVNASASQIDSAASHKAAGNEHFKLGRFPEAEASYSRAISSLPEGHLHLVPLYNNRAATRLKAGDSAAAMADSTIVIDLIGASYHPAKEEPLPVNLATEVKLSDALVKAMIKRAQAAEMAEKWALAADDWEKVLGLDAAVLGNTSVATRALASEGGRRSRKMLAGPVSPTTARPSAPPPTKPAVRSKPADLSKSEAVAELRRTAAANEAEDAQRHAIKDQVDARVQAWKSGKEENLRALIASLDTVLWDGILAGGLKVGMHELIQDKQVKIKYMKVVARLHPDKLNVSDTTVEQRMLASAVFGILSDAWQSFNK